MIRQFVVLDQDGGEVKAEAYIEAMEAHHDERFEDRPHWKYNGEGYFMFPDQGIISIIEADSATIKLNEDEEGDLERDARINGQFTLKEIPK